MVGRLTLHARAKINLHLRVLGRLPGGYHALETVYHSVDLADTLAFERSSGGVSIACDNPTIPTDARNLVAQAASAFFMFTGIAGGLRASITKRIPAGAGLGGGSADAAATFVALNRLYATHYPLAVLERLGATVGADVPFCIRGGAAWGAGIGTALTPLRPAPDVRALIVNPGIHIDTAWAYRALQAPPLVRSPGVGRTPSEAGAAILRAWRGGDPVTVNSFQHPVFEAHAAVRAVRDRLRDHGAAAMMTGSGSTVFGGFNDDDALDEARVAMGDQPFVVVTSLTDRGVVDAPYT
ncbi:4-(cytidine 5'-diphospho)-2-C-methyl-D-erythritol kinase [Candidatus Poribacteria bacterium]|nr:4-(cytidine 5'-diphospho)-2-C-methyl-D-erythritol kinase [Candidatus Poribacteria bacterium]